MHAPRLQDLEPSVDSFLHDVLEGLAAESKRISCKYLYDTRGSQLFDAICELPEYYLTRTELAITRDRANEIAEHIGPRAALVEYGSGSSLKTRILLDHLVDPAAYVPVDISREHLSEAATRIAGAYPDLAVLPVCADFVHPFELPTGTESADRIVAYFPGSTIGNFGPDEAIGMLSGIAEVVGPGGALLLGVDVFKSADILVPAYDDAAGVTNEFNMNLLVRINRELGANFDVDAFRHEAIFNEAETRMEMFLVSERDQTVSIDGIEFSFERGERIHTEYSYKYRPEDFTDIAAAAGFETDTVWTDDRGWFSVQLLVAAD